MATIKLKAFGVNGFKSIQHLERFEPSPINILIGPNGAGKTNFISFFKFLSWMLNSDGRLQDYVAFLGGASDVLFDGPEVTRSMDASIELETSTGLNEYRFSLIFAKPDRLVFAEEAYRYTSNQIEGVPEWIGLGRGHEEAKLPITQNQTASTIVNLMRKLVVYQFHNTSDTAKMRTKWSAGDARYLRQNGENLGSFLFRLQQFEYPYYLRIVKYVRLLLPFFEDFELYEDFGQVLLRWREKGTSKVFHAGQASDGMLRTIALISLLGQNPNNLPAVLFLDEPELGLHPSAIDAVAGLIKAASQYCQMIVATQSISLVNNFGLEDLVVINRSGRASEYDRPDTARLEGYLDEYSVGEIWEKNIIGGRP